MHTSNTGIVGEYSGVSAEEEEWKEERMGISRMDANIFPKAKSGRLQKGKRLRGL